MNSFNITENYAYVNWMMNKWDRAQNYGSLADGYHNASLRLLDSLIADNSNHDADTVIFAALFCAYHSLELYLKGTKIYCCQVDDINPWHVSVADKHDIQKLIDSLNSHFERNERLTKNNPEVKAIFKFLDLYGALGTDEDGAFHPDAMRFPESPTNKKELPKRYAYVVDNGQLRIDIGTTRLIVDEACSLASGIYGMWMTRAEYAVDARNGTSI